jgi:hypothetical protein
VRAATALVVILLAAALVGAPAAAARAGDAARRRTDSPLDGLPPNVEVLTRFGERADISPDDRRVAFMAKSFGDAFVIDLETRVIRCRTGNVPGAAFPRVMAHRAGAVRGRGPRPVAGQRALVPGPPAGVAPGQARPARERGRGRLEAIDEDRLRRRPRAERQGPRGPEPGGPPAFRGGRL